MLISKIVSGVSAILLLGATGLEAKGHHSAHAQISSDDIRADGLKRRGDGSIDYSQPSPGIISDGTPSNRSVSPSHSDNIGPDGLKRRGDGSIDDSQFGDDHHSYSHSGGHVRGRDRWRERERGRDRSRDNERGRDRDRDHHRGRE